MATTRRSLKCGKCGASDTRARGASCGECGAPWIGVITIQEPEIHRMAAIFLRDAGLLVGDVRGQPWFISAQPIPVVLQTPGDVFVEWSRMNEAVDLLAKSGIDVAHGPPLVDRREPVCPDCGFEMDPEAGDVCDECGAPVTWITIDELDFLLHDRECAYCGYTLTGLPEARCPECGKPVLPDTSEIEAIARQSRHAEEPAQRESGSFVAGVVLPLLGIVGALGLLVAFQHDVLWGLLATAVLAPALFAASRILRRTPVDRDTMGT